LFVLIPSNRMFAGVTPDGINREVAAMTESALYCRQVKTIALASIQGSLWGHASRLATVIETKQLLTERDKDLCRGILPTLQFFVGLEYPAAEVIDKSASATIRRHENLVAVNNTNPLLDSIYCYECKFELGNVFFEFNKMIKKTKETVQCCLFCYKGKDKVKHFRYRVAGPVTAHFILDTITQEVGEEAVHYAKETVLRLKVAAARLDDGAHEERLSLIEEAHNEWKSRSHPSNEEWKQISSFTYLPLSPPPMQSDGAALKLCMNDHAAKRQRVDSLAQVCQPQSIETTSGLTIPSSVFTPWAVSSIAPNPPVPSVNTSSLPTQQVTYNLNFFSPLNFVTAAGATATVQPFGPSFTIHPHFPLVPAHQALKLPPKVKSDRECRRCGLRTNDHPPEQVDPSGKKCRETRCVAVACRQSYEAHVERFREKEGREPDQSPEGGLPFVTIVCFCGRCRPSLSGQHDFVFLSTSTIYCSCKFLCCSAFDNSCTCTSTFFFELSYTSTCTFTVLVV
jgi:hypothetical protein